MAYPTVVGPILKFLAWDLAMADSLFVQNGSPDESSTHLLGQIARILTINLPVLSAMFSIINQPLLSNIVVLIDSIVN